MIIEPEASQLRARRVNHYTAMFCTTAVFRQLADGAKFYEHFQELPSTKQMAAP
jgi:hypothetical protein